MGKNARRLSAGWVLLSLLLGSTVALPVQKPLKKIVFLTNYVFLGRHAPFFVGLDKGFYREAGFDISISPSTGSGFVIAALEGGKADYGIAEAAPVVQAVGKGAQVKAFGVFMDISTSGLASLTAYPTPESVAGKTIAASLTDSARVILPIIYNLKDLDPSSLDWLAVDPSIYFPLLLQGRAELVTASIDSDVPVLRRVAQPRGKTIHFSSFAEWGYDVFGYFLVTRADRIVSSPDEVGAFAAATVRAVKYAINQPEEAARILVQHNPTLDYDLTLAHWRQSIQAIDTAYVKEHGYGRATRERLQRSIDLVKEAFRLEVTLAPEDIYAAGFLPD
ncbi:MAG: ABC transporter substrate-binding protein [Acidobacteriota bacterium]